MRSFTFTFLVFVSSMACAQVERTLSPTDGTSRSETYLNYIDSLSVCRARLDSLMAENAVLKASGSVEDHDARYARLFTPPSFYPLLVRRHFSLDPDQGNMLDDQTTIDNALLNIYMNRPDLVAGKVEAGNGLTAEEEAQLKSAISPRRELAQIEAPQVEESGFEPVELVIKKPNFWTYSGEYYLQVMQNYYSANWYQGGESNYSLLGRVTLEANYNNKQKVKWENRLEMNLGLQTNRSDTVHGVKTSTDLLRYTGKLGLQAMEKWYYTLQAIASTQFMKSFDTNSRDVVSDFLSPLTINVSLGMDYTMDWFDHKLTGSIHLAPIAMNYKYVDRLSLSSANGIDEGKHSILDFGSTFTVDGTWKLADNISWTSRLYGYTTYGRTELQWENTFNLQVSKIIAMSIYFYPRFDDSTTELKDRDFGYFQLQEYTSLGITYSF